MIISAWGIVFLGILGVFFYIQATLLFPDLQMPEPEKTDKDHETKEVHPYSPGEIVARYTEKATQCWIAAGLYLVTLIAVFWQNKWNTHSVF